MRTKCVRSQPWLRLNGPDLVWITPIECRVESERGHFVSGWQQNVCTEGGCFLSAWSGATQKRSRHIYIYIYIYTYYTILWATHLTNYYFARFLFLGLSSVTCVKCSVAGRPLLCAFEISPLRRLLVQSCVFEDSRGRIILKVSLSCLDRVLNRND